MPTTGYERLQRTGGAGRVRLGPSALSLHPTGQAEHDDLWWVEAIENGTVRLHNTTTGHFKDLAPSDVLAAELDPHAPQGGLVYLRVRLARQIWLRGAEAGWMPRARRLRPIPRRPR